jgi:hypothetical protein
MIVDYLECGGIVCIDVANVDDSIVMELDGYRQSP